MGEDGLESVYAWSIPILVTVILAEMIYSQYSEAKLYNGKDVATSVCLAVMNFGLDLVMKVFAMTVMFFFYNLSFFTWEFTI